MLDMAPPLDMAGFQSPTDPEPFEELASVVVISLLQLPQQTPLDELELESLALDDDIVRVDGSNFLKVCVFLSTLLLELEAFICLGKVFV